MSATDDSAQAQGGAKLMDRKWEEVQKKTFTKWVCSKIKEYGYKLKDVSSDEMSDGVILAALLSAISDEKVRVNQKPTLRIQKMENVDKCIKFITSKGVSLSNIGASDIVDANPKLLLGMIWTIVLRFTISDISNEGKTAREGLLLWCRRLIEDQYKIKIDNFTSSWADGKAYAALLDSQKSGSFNYDDHVKSSDRERAQAAFDAAENQFMISKLLDVEDVCLLGGPDEKSNMTYIAQYFHAFSENSNVQRAQRRAGNFANSVKAISEMRHDYETRTQALMASFLKVAAEWEKTTFNGTYRDVQDKRKIYRKWKASEKREMISEKGTLATMYSNIQTKVTTFGFKAYTAPTGLTIPDAAKAYNTFQGKESDYLKSLKTKSRQIKDEVQRKFANSAIQFTEKLQNITKKLANLDGDLTVQESAAKGLQQEQETAANELPELEKMWNECLDAGVDDNDEITHTYDDLSYDSTVLKGELAKKVGFLENQRVLGQVSNITPAQRELFEATFRLFDKDNSNTLSSVEFKAALAGLGLNVPEEQLETRLKRSANDVQREISLIEFIDFVKSLEEDNSTQSQIQDAFRTIAGGKSFITEVQLQRAGYPTETVSILLSQMKPVAGEEGGYDYTSMVNETYAN